jgi:hypothetical protein
MFCPKCGQDNPETGKFCRSCGTDLGNVSQALTGNFAPARQVVDHKGRPVSWDRAIIKIFTGIAFIAVAAALALSGSGRGWWFWLLIPAFTSLGAGVAQYIQLKKAESGGVNFAPQPAAMPPAQNAALPPQQTQWATPESRYKTGDLVPPSVTEGTTRHLDIDSEGKTMTLPKK